MDFYSKEDYFSDINFLGQSSIPMLSFDSARKQFFVRGSGFLVFIKDNYFIVTASHVIQSAADTGTGISIPSYNDSGIYRFESYHDVDWRHLDKNHSGAIDLAFVHLNIAEKKQKYIIETYSAINLDSQLEKTTLSSDYLVINGYPANNKNKVNLVAKNAKFKKIQLLSIVDLSMHSEIVDESQGRCFPVIWKKKSTITVLNGLSGAPIFNWHSHDKGVIFKKPTFVGMLIEYRPNRGEIIVAVGGLTIFDVLEAYLNGQCLLL